MASRPGSLLEVVPETDSPRGGRPRDDAREQAILDAALALIAEVGYEAMSMEAVATHAGVSKATIYRRWTGKADLMAEAIRRMHSDGFPDPEDTGNLRGDLVSMTRLMISQMAGVDGGLLCGLAMAMRSDAELATLMDGHKREHRERVQLLIVSRAKARGEIAESLEPPELIDVAAGVALFQVMSGKPLDDTFSDYLVDRVLIPLTK